VEQERPLKERIWEFTKDLSVKVSRKAEKHWKINTLRVEIASIRHRINVKYKELGRTVFDAFKEGTVEEAETVGLRDEIIEELQRLEGDIEVRLARIEALEEEVLDDEAEADETPPPPPVAEDEKKTPGPKPADDEAEQAPVEAASEKTDAEPIDAPAKGAADEPETGDSKEEEKDKNSNEKEKDKT